MLWFYGLGTLIAIMEREASHRWQCQDKANPGTLTVCWSPAANISVASAIRVSAQAREPQGPERPGRGRCVPRPPEGVKAGPGAGEPQQRPLGGENHAVLIKRLCEV